MAFRVAVASDDGKSVNCDFATTDQFFVFELCDNSLQFLEIRKLNNISLPGYRKKLLIKIIDFINDCEMVLASEIGPGAAMLLDNKGIQSFTMEGNIEDALGRIIWVRRKRLFYNKRKLSRMYN